MQIGTVITKYDRETRKSRKVNRFGNVVLYSSLICLATDNLPLGISGKENLRQNQNKEKILHHHNRICDTCELKKQLLRDASCTKNCVSLPKSLENQPLRGVITVNFKVNRFITLVNRYFGAMQLVIVSYDFCGAEFKNHIHFC